MVGPSVATRMTEPNSLARPEISRSNVSSLMAIAQHAGIREVVHNGRSAVLPADNMIDFVHEARVFFMDQTVFAPAIRTQSYFGPKCRSNITGHERGFGELLL